MKLNWKLYENIYWIDYVVALLCFIFIAAQFFFPCEIGIHVWKLYKTQKNILTVEKKCWVKHCKT